MKHARTVLLMLISMFVAYGCTDNYVEDTNQTRKKNSEAALPSNTVEWDTSYDEIDVYECIDRAPYAFGENVLIFESMEEVDMLLEEMEELPYDELRQWCNDHNIWSTYIEAKIVYDSIWQSVEEEFGISSDEQEIREEDLDAFYESLESRLIEYPECWYSWQDKEYGEIMQPKCTSFDIEAFTNDKGIVIIDKVVFKYQQGYLLTCPVHKYADLGEYTQIEDLIMRINYDTDIPDGYLCIVPIYPHEPDEPGTLPPAYPEQETVVETLHSHIVKRGDHKLSVYITAYPYWSWFKTNVRGKAIIENYYKGKPYKCMVYGEIRFGAHFTDGNVSESSRGHFFIAGPNRINGKFKSKTLRDEWYRSNYIPTKRCTATPKWVEMSVAQEGPWGVVIEYTHS